MLHGSCLCGGVAYESGALTTSVGLCHCRTCQKAHASAFAATARAPRAEFAWTMGALTVAHYESSPGKRRWFCPRCGSHLMAERDGEDHVILRVATLDDPPALRPAVHIWMSEASPLLEAPDGVPAYPDGRPAPR